MGIERILERKARGTYRKSRFTYSPAKGERVKLLPMKAVILDIIRETGEARPRKVMQLVKENYVGISETAMRKHLEDLTKLGLIQVQKRRGRVPHEEPEILRALGSKKDPLSRREYFALKYGTAPERRRVIKKYGEQN